MDPADYERSSGYLNEKSQKETRAETGTLVDRKDSHGKKQVYLG